MRSKVVAMWRNQKIVAEEIISEENNESPDTVFARYGTL